MIIQLLTLPGNIAVYFSSPQMTNGHQVVSPCGNQADPSGRYLSQLLQYNRNDKANNINCEKSRLARSMQCNRLAQ